MDLDSTIVDTPTPEIGKKMWEDYYDKPYPYSGWWGRPESLDLNVFDIKPFPNVLAQLRKESATPDTFVLILTSRIEKLRSQVEAVLNANNIKVDKVDMKRAEGDKGVKVMRYVEQLPDLKIVNVYEDRDIDLEAYERIRSQIPEGIEFNIYVANKGNLSLGVVKESVNDFTAEDEYVYHGTYDGAGYHIQRTGGMKINAADNGEPFISFTSNPNVAKYYADMKGGGARGIVLRTKRTPDFKLSPKFDKNKGHEWITTREIPADELEIRTNYGWTPLNNWDLTDLNKNIQK